jgi:hypothetical protein
VLWGFKSHRQEQQPKIDLPATNDAAAAGPSGK